ncbi:MAG: HEAT repeat domain-containing protein [Elusimicrobiota bacterium]
MFRSKHQTDHNPLSGLPGNREISKQIEKVITDPGKVVVYVDIKEFKPYNEVYGFTAGDNVILTLSDILKTICRDVCTQEYFLGHIGGDDFLIIAETVSLDMLFERIDKDMSTAMLSFYRQPDISRGFIVGWDRHGRRTRFPLMGVYAVAFIPCIQKLNSVEQVSEYATYLKESAKTRSGSDNLLVRPEDLDILPVPMKDFIKDNSIPLVVRRTVIEAMGECGLLHYGRMLMEMLDEPLNVFLKKSIIFSLGRLRYAPAEGKLLEFTENRVAHLRTRAVEALGYLGGAKHLKKIGSMVSDPNPYVSVMAVKSIGNIGHPEGLEYLKGVPEHASRWLKMETAFTRALLGDRTAAGSLVSLIEDKNPVFRRRAAASMEHLPSVEGIKCVCKAVKKESIDDIKESMIHSLGRMVFSLPSSSLKEISSEIWNTYRRIPVEMKAGLLAALGRCRIKNARMILEEKLDSPGRFERQMAVEGMVSYGREEHVYLLRKMLKDRSSMVRASSARGLGQINDINGLEFLRLSLKDPDEMVKRTAAESILKIAASGTIRCGAAGDK